MFFGAILGLSCNHIVKPNKADVLLVVPVGKCLSRTIYRKVDSFRIQSFSVRLCAGDRPFYLLRKEVCWRTRDPKMKLGKYNFVAAYPVSCKKSRVIGGVCMFFDGRYAKRAPCRADYRLVEPGVIRVRISLPKKLLEKYRRQMMRRLQKPSPASRPAKRRKK